MRKSIGSPARVAIIGAGGISGAHIRGYLKLPDRIRCVALCDISPEALATRSVQLAPAGEVRTFDDWRTMLRDMGDQLDAVDICLPHHLHAPAILDAVAAGKHVLCEKPMCLTLDEADRISAAVESSGITYLSGHNQLFMPVVREAKRLIDAGEIGTVRWLRSQDCFTAGRARAQWGWRADLATQGGGELIDTGYHPTYRLLHLAGAPVAEVRATMGRFDAAIDGEDTAAVSVRFTNGVVGEIFTSWAMNLPHGTHHIHVVGEKGQIFGSDDTLYLLPRGFSEPAKRSFAPVETFGAEIAHFADCLLDHRSPIHSVKEGRAVLEVILGAAASADGWQGTAAFNG